MEKGPATANENSTGSGDVQSATKVPENVVKSCLEDKATELVEKHNDSASGSIVTDGSSAVNKQCTKLTVSEEGAHFTNSKDNGDVSVKTNNESLQTDSVGKETEGPKVSDKVILADEPIPKKLEPAEEKKSVTDEGEKIALASNEAKVSAKEESAVSEKTSTDNESAIVKESTSAMSEESLSDKTVSKEGVPDTGKMPSEEKSVSDTRKMPSEEKRKMPSEEKSVSDTRKMPSGEKSVPDSGKMPSEEKSVADTGKMPSEEKSVSDTGKMPSEEKSVSDTRKMPSGEKSVPDSGKMPSEEKSVPDTGKIPSEEKSVAAKEELDSGTSNKDKDAVSEAVQLDKECKSDQVAIDECISEEKVLPKKDGDSGKTLDNDSVSDETSISKSVTLEKIDTSDKEKVALTKESGSEKGTSERGHAPEKIDTSDKEKVALAKENGSEKETSERGHEPEKIDAFDKEKVALTKESGSEKETSEKGHAPEIVAEGEEKLSETDGVDKESKPVNAIIDKKIHDKESVTLEERTKSKEESSVKRSESESVNTPKVNLAKENTLEQVPTHINAPEEASIVINKVDVLSSTELDKNSASVAKETVSLKNKCIPENVALDNKSTPDKECISEKTIDKERTVAPEDIKAVPSVNEKALLPEGKDSVRVIGENSEEAHAKKDTSTNSISSDKVSTKLENKILDPVDTEKTLSEEPASINSSEKSEDDNIKIETPVKVENDEDLAMETSTNSAMETSTNSAMETSTNSDKAMDCDSESNCSEVHESITEKKHLQVISSEKSDENPPKLDENPPKSDENPPKSDEKVDNARKFTLDTSEEMRLAIDRVVRQRYPEVIEEEERERELRALSKASKPASENTKLFSEVHTPKYSPKPPVTPYDSDDSDNFFPPPSPTPVFPSTKNPVMGQSPKKEGTQLVETDSLDESQNPSSDLSKLEKQGSEISENNGDSSETEMENEVPKSVGKEIENSSAESKEKDESFSENQKQPPSGKADANSSKEMILPDESKKSETREPVALNKNQQREDDSKSVLLDEAKAPNTENKRSAQLEESAKPKTISLSIGEKPVGAGSPKAKDRESETENSGSEAKKSELVVDGEDDSQDDIFSQDTCNSKPG
ncbi:hypothetical protein C0J52_02992 [Blattella germanica]|nr:hypothetical protein C0J52_02992 [Blattella germanica]